MPGRSKKVGTMKGARERKTSRRDAGEYTNVVLEVNAVINFFKF